jgi:hypothetical protein
MGDEAAAVDVVEAADSHFFLDEDADLFFGLADGGGGEGGVFGFDASAGQGHVSRPGVVGVFSSLDEQGLKATVGAFAQEYGDGGVSV